MPRVGRWSVGLCLALWWSAAVSAGEWYVGPNGTPAAAGSRSAPWDLASALSGKQPIRPGDTVYLLGGVYRRRPQENWEARLAGSPGQPVHVRPAPGERPRIDGGLAVHDPAAHLWVWDLEVFVSEPHPEKPVGPGSHPADFKRPWGGLHLFGGRGCKFIGLVIHDCRQGVSAWSGARDVELSGCIIYDNGWPAVDRGHGHAIYTQNREGVKTIADCIMTGGHGYTMHAYGSKRADVDHFHVEGNVCYRAGTFLIGGGKPSKGLRVLSNYLHGVSMRLGYDAPYNEDCEVRDNLIVDGSLTINRFKSVVNENNRILGRAAPRPGGLSVMLRPNKWDPSRAHLLVLNWERRREVVVELAPFLKTGERYRLLDPRDAFGTPVVSGTYGGRPIAVAVDGEFAVFVVRRDGAESH